MIYFFMFFLSTVHADLKYCESLVDLAKRHCDTTEKIKDNSSLLHFKGKKCEPTAKSIEISYKNLTREEAKSLGPHVACVEKSVVSKERSTKDSLQNVSFQKVDVNKVKTVRYFNGLQTIEELIEEPNFKSLSLISADKYRLTCAYEKDGEARCTSEHMGEFGSRVKTPATKVILPTEDELNQLRKGESLENLIKPLKVKASSSPVSTGAR